jgi:hypothetical protein
MIILINGNQPRCGKDLLAKQFELLGFMHLKFATALHKDVCKVFNIEQPQDDEKDKTKFEQYGNVSYRQLLIVHGTTKKHDDLLVWSKKLYEEVVNINAKNYVVSDWGFPYELYFLNHKADHDIITVHVKRPLSSPIPDSRHNLEHLCAYTLDNSGTRYEYIIKCKELVHEVIEKYGKE